MTAAARAPGTIWRMPQALMTPMLPVAALLAIGALAPATRHRLPEEMPYWAFFFGLPHIVSSFLTLCDRQYIAAYRRRLIAMPGLCLLPLALHAAGVPGAVVLTAVLVLTVHHIVAQQYGIALSVAGLRPSRAFRLCKWSTFLLGTAAYLDCYAGDAARTGDGLRWLHALAQWLEIPLCAIVVATGGMLMWRARARRAGVLLLGANIAIFLASLLLIGQPRHALFGLMAARVLHDATGFVVYIGHDSARNRTERRNFFYRVVPGLPTWVANPALALAIAAATTYLASRSAAVGWGVVGLTLAHYYSESFIWRGGTPHRQSFRMAGS